jgi:phosphatidylglycerol:prolipoprotein diacylglycerol transferase
MTIFEMTLFGITIAPSYYGLMYVIGFLYWVWYLKKHSHYSTTEQESLFLYIFIWTILWGRLWYVLFYNLSSYIITPLDIIKVWDGWMSFHWGFLWVVIALYLFSIRKKVLFWNLADTIAMIIPVWLFFGRIGNYINKELLWFAYEGPLAVVTSSWSYFPSPLLEALWEWVLIFIIFYFILKKPAFAGQFAALFLIIYGVVRTLIELFIRTPDAQIGYYLGFITQWSILSMPMVIIWWALYYYVSKQNYAAK